MPHGLVIVDLARTDPAEAIAQAVDPDDRIVCDVSAVDHPDVATVDSMARLCLGAMRAQRPMAVRGASPALRDLIAFVGLAGVFYPRRRAAAKPSGVEVER
ncbi:MAG: STAS domain-containing protein [Chloroflexi bacterium]|nr:MAG: STAS domain-containing protein [Chloroflexota bacterium]